MARLALCHKGLSLLLFVLASWAMLLDFELVEEAKES